MQPATIDYELRPHARAAPCAELAVVHSVRHEYQTQLYRNLGPIQHELLASHYEIECPKRGRRTKVVAAGTE